jgi:hypothetical protein
LKGELRSAFDQHPGGRFGQKTIDPLMSIEQTLHRSAQRGVVATRLVQETPPFVSGVLLDRFQEYVAG